MRQQEGCYWATRTLPIYRQHLRWHASFLHASECLVWVLWLEEGCCLATRTLPIYRQHLRWHTSFLHGSGCLVWVLWLEECCLCCSLYTHSTFDSSKSRWSRSESCPPWLCTESVTAVFLCNFRWLNYTSLLIFERKLSIAPSVVTAHFFICLSLSVCQSVCVSLSLSVCLSVSVSPSLSLSLSLSLLLSVSLSVSVCLSVCLPACVTRVN